jgi:hypothetical protein
MKLIQPVTSCIVGWPFYTVTDLEMRTLNAGIAVMATGSFVQSYGKLMALATFYQIRRKTPCFSHGDIRHFALHPFRDVKSKFLNSLFKTW